MILKKNLEKFKFTPQVWNYTHLVLVISYFYDLVQHFIFITL